MSMKHTPGPWRTLPEEVDKDYVRVRGTRLGLRYKIANVLTTIYEGVPAREADETRANAALIAAAPDLLEALQALLAIYPYPDNETTDAARAAIAKATGEKA